jgi:quinol monooxygenase YgiN
MFKFVIMMRRVPGVRDEILAAAPAVQSQARAEPGGVAYDFLACTDDPDKLVFAGGWESREAHAWHCERDTTKRFVALREPKHLEFSFELIDAETL